MPILLAAGGLRTSCCTRSAPNAHYGTPRGSSTRMLIALMPRIGTTSSKLLMRRYHDRLHTCEAYSERIPVEEYLLYHEMQSRFAEVHYLRFRFAHAWNLLQRVADRDALDDKNLLSTSFSFLCHCFLWSGRWLCSPDGHSFKVEQVEAPLCLPASCS